MLATGPLHHKHYPKIEGLDTFEGAAFHSADWDESVKLEGKRIGVIGTGSTAVQMMTPLSEVASHVTMFQRTAQWIVKTRNDPFTEEEKQQFRTDADLLKRLYLENQETFHDGFSNMIVDAQSGIVERIEEGCNAYLSKPIDEDELWAKVAEHIG